MQSSDASHDEESHDEEPLDESLNETVTAAPSAAKKQSKKRKKVTTTTTAAKKKAAITKTTTQTSNKPKSKSNEKVPSQVAAQYLLTDEAPSTNSNPWEDNNSVQWTKEASSSIKNIFKQDMLFGSIKGAAVAAADFAKDVKTCTKWIRFGNGRTSTSNRGNSLGNIIDDRQKFPSLEPIFRVIDSFCLQNHMSTPPQAWIHGNGSVTSSGVTNTHGQHRDRRTRFENVVQHIFGVETKRVLVAVSFTPPTGVHEGRFKETRYTYQGQEVLRLFANQTFSFTMMGIRANGKDPFFDTRKLDETSMDEDGEIALLGGGDDDNDDDDDDDVEKDDLSPTNPYMKHGVYNNAGALSVMCEVTIEDGKVYEFYEALSACYDDYVPSHSPGSVQFEFPNADKSYVEPKAEEKRLLIAKAFEKGPLVLIENFIRERGHGAIADRKICNFGGPIDPRLIALARMIRMLYQKGALIPQIKEMCVRVGFVFTPMLWQAERTVEMMEEYCQGGADINTIPQKTVVQGYDLGQSIANWKSMGAPGWMERPEFKSRLDVIGFDLTLNAKQAKFAARCRELKRWKLRHGGANPRKRAVDREETLLYQFQYQTQTGKYNCGYMKIPKLKALFDEARASGEE